MSYPPRIPCDGVARSIPVAPPHSGACQGGYGNVWISLSYDDPTQGTVHDTLAARVVGLKFDGTVFPLDGGNGNLAIPRTRAAWQLPPDTASVSVECSAKNKNGQLLEISPMVEAETRGVPAA